MQDAWTHQTVLLNEAVEAENGNLSAAARRLGLTRAQLAYRLQHAVRQ